MRRRQLPRDEAERQLSADEVVMMASDARLRREARSLLTAAGYDLTVTCPVEEKLVERLEKDMGSAVARIERVGFSVGWSEASAWWQEWIWPSAPDPDVVNDGLGRPRG